MKTPYLVQRGKFKTPDKIEGIDSLVQFDYMGSAEFEFGALPKALKEICAVLPQLKISNIKYGNKTIWLLCRDQDQLQLVEFWNTALVDRYAVRTKELMWYGGNISSNGNEIGSDDTNFWWDIGENQCWMAALGSQEQIENVKKALELVKKKKGW